MTDNELKDLIASAVGDKLKEIFGGIVSQSRYSLFEWLGKWLENEHKPNVSERVYKNNCGLIQNHIYTKKKYDKPLSDFKPMDLQSLIQSIPFSRQRVIAANMLIAALRSAYNNDFIAKDITQGFKKPTHEYEEDRALTRVERRRFLRLVCGHKMEVYFKLVFYSGLRRNEALGLTRGDIDFDNDYIYVRRQVTINGEFTDKLKTKGSRRTVKLFPELKRVLQPFECCKPNVRLFDFKPVTVTHSFKRFCEDAGLKDISLKSLRTTFGTMCDEMGIPDKIIQAWLGHTTFKTTKQHYIKLNEDYVNAEFEKALKKVSKNG